MKETKQVDLVETEQDLQKQEEEKFQEKWRQKISHISNLIMPNVKIEPPSEPYQPEEIRKYIKEVKPEVHRGRIWQVFMVSTIVIGLIFSIIGFGGYSANTPFLFIVLLFCIFAHVLWFIFWGN